MSQHIEDFGIATNVRTRNSPSAPAQPRLSGARVRAAEVLPMRRASTSQPEADSSGLIAAAPLLALLGDLWGKVVVGGWDLDTPEERVFRRVAERLAAALDEARRADVWVTIPELSSACRRPVATLTRWCRSHGAGAWARKEDGTWVIHYPSFQLWLATQTDEKQAAA